MHIDLVRFSQLPIDQRCAWMNLYHPLDKPNEICGNCIHAFRSLNPLDYKITCAWGGECDPFKSPLKPVHHQPAHHHQPVHQQPVHHQPAHHQQPVHHQPAHHQAGKKCPLGGACPIRNCAKGTHPEDCRWGKKCTRDGCLYRHYGPVHCQFGGRCTAENCTKRHPEPCKSGNNCHNQQCPFTHKPCRWDANCTFIGCSKWHPTRNANKLKLAN